MEIDILDSLEDLGYSGPIKDQVVLDEVLKNGLTKTDYTDLVTWLVGEIHNLLELESTITATLEPADPLNFLLELSSFLKEMNCPHSTLLEGPLDQRLDSHKNRLLLLDYLCGELLTARIVSAQQKKDGLTWEVEMESSSMAEELESIAKLLGIKDPASQAESSHQLLESFCTKLEEKLKKAGNFPKPLLGTDLTPQQWEQLSKLDSLFRSEYGLRREMLLTRLDATIRTFSWSDRLKDKHDKITAAYLPIRSKLHPRPSVHLGDFLCAREDLLQIEKTSSSEVRKNTKSSVNKVLIGAVPDRGGRPEEQNPPPPEMPPWMKRGQGGQQQRGGFQGGRGGGFQGRGGGNFQSQGRGGGSWNQQRGGGQSYGNKSSYNYNDRGRGGGFYSNRSDSYYSNRGGDRRRY